MKKYFKSIINIPLMLIMTVYFLVILFFFFMYFYGVFSTFNEVSGGIGSIILFIVIWGFVFWILIKSLIYPVRWFDEKFNLNIWKRYFSYKNAFVRTFILFPFVMPFVLWNGLMWYQLSPDHDHYKVNRLYTLLFLLLLLVNVIYAIVSVYQADKKIIIKTSDEKINEIFNLLESRNITKESYITYCPSCAAVDILDLGKTKSCLYCNQVIGREEAK